MLQMYMYVYIQCDDEGWQINTRKLPIHRHTNHQGKYKQMYTIIKFHEIYSVDTSYLF